LVYNVEDIESQSSIVFGIQHDWRDPISGVHVSPDSAETLVRRGGITNYRSLAYSLGKVSAKNAENRLMCVELRATSVSFFWDTVYMIVVSIKHCMWPTTDLLNILSRLITSN